MDINLIGFGENGYRHRRGMDTTRSLGLGHPLYAMHPSFELEPTVRSLAFDHADDFFEPAQSSRTGAHDFDAPAMILGIARVHAKEVSDEQACLFTSGPCPDFQENVFFI